MRDRTTGDLGDQPQAVCESTSFRTFRIGILLDLAESKPGDFSERLQDLEYIRQFGQLLRLIGALHLVDFFVHFCQKGLPIITIIVENNDCWKSTITPNDVGDQVSH